MKHGRPGLKLYLPLKMGDILASYVSFKGGYTFFIDSECMGHSPAWFRMTSYHSHEFASAESLGSLEKTVEPGVM